MQEAIDDVWDLVQTPASNEFFGADEDYILLDYDPLDDEVAYLSEINPDLEIGAGNYQGDYLENHHESYPVIPQSIPQSIGEFALNNQTANAPVVSFRLDQDHFMAQQGEYLVITGRVEIALGALLSSEELPAELRDTCLQGSVHYQLRDPDSSSILVNTDYPLQVKVPVGEFSHTLKIPFKTNSHLILGEATLYGKEQQVLGSKSFIVSANLDRLLQTVQDTPEDLPQTVATPSKRQNYPVLPYQPKLDIDPKARKAFAKPLNSSYNAKGRIKSLHLPDFSGKTAANLEGNLPPLANPAQNPNQAPDQLNTLDNFIANLPATISNFGQGSPLSSTRSGEAIESPATPEILATPATPDIIEALTIPTTPESLETPEAGLSEGNFLSRLNTLAIDKQMTEILHTELLLDQAAPGATHRQLLPPASDPDWRVLEVVVDDEPPEPETEPRFDASGFPYPQKLTAPTAAALTPDQTPRPVPTPEIIAPAGELLTGESVTVTVKLPAQQFSLYAKFWVKDCQTTAIIDGPRLLLDFAPNGQGELETLTRLTVPPGCCRVRLEAIAIDPLQEKESRKVSIDRVVVPPDTPDLSATGLSYLAG
ncbi:MAG: hypothetical protein HC916_13930 [Coleofasciculaceae cyanobacterium SM2_1_6]|nr:hypothetical protein [Coleofasciculaceae cyanobacterium SM2_1_6]